MSLFIQFWIDFILILCIFTYLIWFLWVNGCEIHKNFRYNPFKKNRR